MQVPLSSVPNGTRLQDIGSARHDNSDQLTSGDSLRIRASFLSSKISRAAGVDGIKASITSSSVEDNLLKVVLAELTADRDANPRVFVDFVEAIGGYAKVRELEAMPQPDIHAPYDKTFLGYASVA